MTARTHFKQESIYQVLEDRILRGSWAVGCLIPTEKELAEEFQCSRITVGKAIAQLVQEGLVERRKRVGTRVIRDSSGRESSSVELDAYAFIYPSDQHDSIWRTLKGFQKAAQQTGRRVVMLPSGKDYQKEVEFIGRLAEFDVKGAVVFPVLPTRDDVIHFSQVLASSKLPVVLTEVSLPSLGYPTVVVDGFHAGYTMTAHLIGRGAQKIGFLANYAHIPSVRDEYRGYLWALEEVGLKPPEGGTLLDPDMHPNFENPLEESVRLSRQLLERASGLDAVVCANDYLAAGCIMAAKEIGLRVPHDLKIVGCDDYMLSPVEGIALTTYHISHTEIGRKTFEILDQLVAGKELVYHETHVRGHLKEGASA